MIDSQWYFSKLCQVETFQSRIDDLYAIHSILKEKIRGLKIERDGLLLQIEKSLNSEDWGGGVKRSVTLGKHFLKIGMFQLLEVIAIAGLARKMRKRPTGKLMRYEDDDGFTYSSNSKIDPDWGLENV